MNENNLRIDFEKIDEIIGKLNNKYDKIETSIVNIGNAYDGINSPDVWKGNAEKAFYDKCSEMAKQYPDILESLKAYITFLQQAKELLKEFDDKTQKALEEKENEA